MHTERSLSWRTRAYRITVVVFLLLHGATVGASLLRATPPGEWLRARLRPYESLVGVYQNWNMFAPSPPVSDTWGTIRAVDVAGASHVLPAVWGAREDVAIEYFYRRAGKLERNLLLKKRQKYLKMYARALCADEPRWERIEVDRVLRRTPRPLQRRAGQRPSTSTEPALRLSCP